MEITIFSQVGDRRRLKQLDLRENPGNQLIGERVRKPLQPILETTCRNLSGVTRIDHKKLPAVIIRITYYRGY